MMPAYSSVSVQAKAVYLQQRIFCIERRANNLDSERVIKLRLRESSLQYIDFSTVVRSQEKFIHT